jgi:type II secretory pathway predicted ATPase ExeA
MRVENDDVPFPFSDFVEAKKTLLDALAEREPYMLLTGDSGAGKTSLLREVRRGIDRCRIRLFYFNLARLSPAGLVRVLARNLRMPPLRSQPETVQAIVKILGEEPWHALVVVDEANMVPGETFDELRTMAEVKLGGPTPFSVLLSGRTTLRERLRAPHLFPLWRRILTRVEITGLTREEVRPFAEHAVGVEAAERITDEALAVLFESARGIPGLLCPYLRVVLRHPGEEPILPETAERLIQDFDLP